MNDSYLIGDNLKNKLEEITGLSHYASGESELIARCPFPDCEVENGIKKHGRLYIHTKEPVFHCFRCQRSGSIYKLLNYLKLNPKDYIDESLIKSRSPISKYISDVSFDNSCNLSFPSLQSSYTHSAYQNKLNYLYSRVGENLIIDNIPNLVLNIPEFLTSNNVVLSQQDLRNIQFYNNNYIGFVGVKGSILNMRNIHSTSDEDRYHKLFLSNGKKLAYSDFYGVKLSSLKSDSINTILVMEGVFDLLNGCRSKETKHIVSQCCYAACGFGSNYKSLIKSVLNYLHLPISNVIVFSDKDKELSDKIYRTLTNCPNIKSVEIYYNKVEKDFGGNTIYPTYTSFTPKEYFNKWRYNYRRMEGE